MSFDHLNIIMPSADKDTVIQHIADIKATMPFLITLNEKDKKQKYAYARRKDEFVKNTLAFAKSKPQFVPGAIDVTDWENDVTLLEQLTLIKRLLAQVDILLADTILALRCETSKTTLFHYKTLEILAKNGVPDVEVFFEKIKHSRGQMGGRKKIKKVEVKD